MKKLLVLLVLLVSGLGYSQTQSEVDVMMENCVSSMAVGIDDMMKDLNEWARTTRQYKTGDNDAPELLGVLETIFTNPKSKNIYGVVNPRILDLRINGFAFHEDNTLSYDEWIRTIKMMDKGQYDIVYNVVSGGKSSDGQELYTESIRVYSKKTGEKVRVISIDYNGENLRCISDNSINLLK